jgi:hypothetical protein
MIVICKKGSGLVSPIALFATGVPLRCGIFMEHVLEKRKLQFRQAVKYLFDRDAICISNRTG